MRVIGRNKIRVKGDEVDQSIPGVCVQMPDSSLMATLDGPEKARNFPGTIQFRSPFSTRSKCSYSSKSKCPCAFGGILKLGGRLFTWRRHCAVAGGHCDRSVGSGEPKLIKPHSRPLNIPLVTSRTEMPNVDGP